jgi:formamidopyrimidine-DNA glycosylase
MPELPEVQTVIEGIKPKIFAKKIIDFKKYISKLRYPISRSIRKKITGRLVKAIYRRAKYIIIDLEGNQSIIIHLGMSGRIIISESTDNQLSKHTHFIIKFSNQIDLIYIDPRRFGLIKVLPSNSLFKSKIFSHLGVEPLGKEFSGRYLKEICENKKSSIKSTIMNQKYVVGIGNIYASESLFLSKVNPLKDSCLLTIQECNLIVKSVKKVLNKSIKLGGSSINDYAMASGKLGNYQNKLEVYGREGSICRKRTCQSKILRIVIAQRSTFYCPVCQK